jgi:hypothetical protein
MDENGMLTRMLPIAFLIAIGIAAGCTSSEPSAPSPPAKQSKTDADVAVDTFIRQQMINQIFTPSPSPSQPSFP